MCIHGEIPRQSGSAQRNPARMPAHTHNRAKSQNKLIYSPPQPMSEQPKEEKPDNTHINLKVSDGTAEIFFKIKKTTPMKRLMEAFCKRQGKSMESLRFLIDGTRVSPDNTPEDLDLEDGDVIEAHREQVGGAL